MEKVSLFHSAKLYPILDLDFCQTRNISLFETIHLWNRFPDCITFFQFRAKSIRVSDYSNHYFQILNEFPDAKMIVNDFWEFALEVNAFGFHIGKEDYASLSTREQSKIRDSKGLIKGTSSHSLEDLKSLETGVWEYSGFGPIFTTSTKLTSNPVLGIETLKKAILETKIPLVPIGGIDSENFFTLYSLGKILPASISMMTNEKSMIKVVDFIRTYTHSV